MALGSNNNKSSGPLYVLKVVDKDKDKKKVPPHFSVSKKVDGKFQVQKETYNRVSGNLTRIDIKEQEWKGDKYNTVSLYLKDGEDMYLVDLRFNLPSRSLFNSLAALESYSDVAVTVYENKSGYTALGLWQGETLVKWKYKLDELPQPDGVVFKGKTQYDYSKVDEFFVKVLQEIAGKLGGSQKTVKSTEKPTEAAGADSDTPF